VTFVTVLPWLAMSLMAMYIYSKRKESKLLLVQAAGAAGMFALPLGQGIIYPILGSISISDDLLNAERIIYRFMLFVMLCVFAIGYCLERFTKRTEVDGFPVQP
jgi:hypothetical protein